MIALVSGTVVEKFDNSLVVDVQGLGYEVAVPLGDYEAALLNEPIKLHTYHHIREQSQELFGFNSLAAKRLFELLISVQGVGPKAGLAILSIADSETVRSAIASSDTAFIAKATGVGKKTAERVTVDLRDKVGAPTVLTDGGAAPVMQTAPNDEALEALMALGFTLQDASEALKDIDPNLPTAHRVTLALKQ
ncbi:MAG: Holliday junction branch migration protein RuvA [Candidatus Saccharimonadales bacterium]